MDIVANNWSQLRVRLILTTNFFLYHLKQIGCVGSVKITDVCMTWLRGCSVIFTYLSMIWIVRMFWTHEWFLMDGAAGKELQGIANIMSKCYTFSLQRIIFWPLKTHMLAPYVRHHETHSLYIGFAFHLLATT
jgi:hypothetical protein